MKLGRHTLKDLPSEIQKPGYRPDHHGVGIVHLGIGAFHRCHMAVYVDDILATQGGDWRIRGVSLRSSTIGDQLNPQDGLYTVLVKDERETHARVVGSVAGVLWAPQDPQAVVDEMAAATTKIISLTVTEKGYCHDPATGRLNTDHPDIRHDLSNPHTPQTALGFLCRALDQRRTTGAGGMTVLCCDNLPSNGEVLKGLVGELARQISSDLAHWIEQEVRFPSTMVDRIVPAIRPELVGAFQDKYGVEDAGLLQTEPFSQWVIEDAFATDTPDWAAVGASVVAEVGRFEDAKLRMLNGSHSVLAYVGYLLGYEFVHDAMDDQRIAALVDYLMQYEAAASILPPAGLDLNAYRRDLQGRFNNGALGHRTYQIAMDGSQKIPQRLLETIRVQLKTNRSFAACAFGVAAWMRYLLAMDEAGKAFEIQDPLAEELCRTARENAGDVPRYVGQMMKKRAIFGDDLPTNAAFMAAVEGWLGIMMSDGVGSALDRFCETETSDRAG